MRCILQTTVCLVDSKNSHSHSSNDTNVAEGVQGGAIIPSHTLDVLWHKERSGGDGIFYLVHCF